MSDEMGDRIRARQLREKLAKRVRHLSAQGKIKWTDHAFERLEERGIDLLVAKRVLMHGDLKEDSVKKGNKPGEWKVVVVDRVKQNRDVGVVTVVAEKGHLRVITVEWEDLG
jgi:hypothetical protein